MKPFLLCLLALVLVGCESTQPGEATNAWARGLSSFGENFSGGPKTYYTHGGYQTKQEHNEYVAKKKQQNSYYAPKDTVAKSEYPSTLSLNTRLEDGSYLDAYGNKYIIKGEEVIHPNGAISTRLGNTLYNPDGSKTTIEHN